MIINVTQKDIENGRHGCSRCPIALAASRAYGRQVWINQFYIVNSVNGGHILAHLPPTAQHFVYWFDNRKTDLLKPFLFEVP